MCKSFLLARPSAVCVCSASHIADRISKVTPLPTTASITTSSSDNTIGLIEGIEEHSRQVASMQASQTQSSAWHSYPTHTLLRLLQQNHRNLSPAPPHLLVPLEVWGRSPNIQPTMLSVAEGLPPSKRIPPRKRPSPNGKQYQQTIMAASVCTTSSGHIFFIDHKSKQRYVV